jgi:hypothetical protein
MTKIENDTSQSERREILRNDRLARSTYLDHAIARAEDEAGGRFAKQAPTTVTGGPQYPRQPAGSPWSQGHVVGPEAPLGFSVDAIEPVGTPAEVQRSSVTKLATPQRYLTLCRRRGQHLLRLALALVVLAQPLSGRRSWRSIASGIFN